ncbi:signal peptidase II [Rhodobacteraceae bacterium NNCM2]|nr:signal peptidase II [Coraliihabitans acroporae]
MIRPIVLLLGIAALVLGLDQVTKWWVVWELDLANRYRIDVIPPYLVLMMAWNEGINFGLQIAGRWVLISMAVIISIALSWWVLRRGQPVLIAAAGLIVGGAIGNAVDRVLYGAVADFLNMSCCGIDNPFAFNVADIAIFLGAVVIAVKS